MAFTIDRLKSAYNAFMGRDPTSNGITLMYGSSTRPDRMRHRIQNERSVINTIFNRIAVDAASIDLKHVRLNKDGRYDETIFDSLNRILGKEANVDQTGRALVSDLVYSLLDEGCAALFPSYTDGDPAITGSIRPIEARVAKVVEWYPRHVRVEAYNDKTGQKSQVVIEKEYVPIVENPFYPIMNEPSSTMQRYIRVLNQLDRCNEQTSAGKLDLIVQLPYDVKTRARKLIAEERRKNLEAQLTNGQYGIGFIDGSEKIIQLNRPLENNLWAQAKELKEDVFNQMGLTMEILNGTADESTMLNYYSRIIEPILTAIVEEIDRKWISRTAQSQGQAIRYYRNPFKLVPVGVLAEIADKFTRNEIMSSNEIRTEVGLPPSKDPKADMLINSNLNQPEENVGENTAAQETIEKKDYLEKYNKYFSKFKIN